MAVKKAVKVYSEAISRSRRGRLMGLTRANTGGSKQTRTADPLLVRQRQYVRQHPPLYVPASQSGFVLSAYFREHPRTTLRGYTLGYIPRPRKETRSKIN